METIKRTVIVTITKEIEIEIMPSMFRGRSEEEYLAEFSKHLWKVESMDDIARYAARTAAHYGGGSEHDGIGLLSEHYSTYPRVPDVKFREISDETEAEIL